MNVKSLTRRVDALQQATPDGYEPITVIERVIVDMQGQPTGTVLRRQITNHHIGEPGER